MLISGRAAAQSVNLSVVAGILGHYADSFRLLFQSLEKITWKFPQIYVSWREEATSRNFPIPESVLSTIQNIRTKKGARIAERMSQSPFIANPPSVFLDPIVSSDHVVCNDPVTIREIVMDPNGVSGVEIHFWVVNKATGKTRYEFRFANDICTRWTLFTSGATDFLSQYSGLAPYGLLAPVLFHSNG